MPASKPIAIKFKNDSTTQNEIKTITITGTPTGGTFTLTIYGKITGTIAYNASSSTVVTALVNMDSGNLFASADLSGGGGSLPGTAVTVEFQGSYALTDIPAMTADATGLTGGSSPAVSITETTSGSDGIVPAYGVIKITGSAAVGSSTALTADVSSADGSEGKHYINGPFAVPIGKYGDCYHPSSPTWALYDTAQTPAFDESWGPVSGSFELKNTTNGFTIVGSATNGRVLVREVSGGGGVSIIRVQILTVDCSICTATATVMARPPGVVSVQGEAAGVVSVFDFAGCFLNAPSLDLVGKQGFAAYLDGGVGDCGVDPDVVNRWEIHSICCAEEDCP